MFKVIIDHLLGPVQCETSDSAMPTPCNTDCQHAEGYDEALSSILTDISLETDDYTGIVTEGKLDIEQSTSKVCVSTRISSPTERNHQRTDRKGLQQAKCMPTNKFLM